MNVAANGRCVSLDEIAERFVGSHVRKPTHILREYRLAMSEMKTFAAREGIVDLEMLAAMDVSELGVWASAVAQRIAPEADSFDGARRALQIADIFFRWTRRRGYLDGETEAAKTETRSRRPQAVAVGSHG
jgi:hypothetical protein